MPRVEFQQVSKSFAGRRVLDQVELVVADGEYLVLLGPSGSGKTTLLRILAGLEAVDTGRITVDGRNFHGVDPADREVSLVFQNHALYPHLTSRENLTLPLRLRGVPSGEARTRVDETAAALGLSGLLDRLPEQLSGGERQRVALGRALIARPRILLLDEPLSDLDPALRTQLRGELRRLGTQHRLTVIHVTHDQREALSLGDRVAVLRTGVLQQVGTPEDVYQHPVNTFVARFIGDPPMNLWPMPDGFWIGVRSEHLNLESDGEAVLAGKIVRQEYTGRDRWLVISHSTGEIVCLAPSTQPLPPVGTLVRLYASAANQRRFKI